MEDFKKQVSIYMKKASKTARQARKNFKFNLKNLTHKRKLKKDKRARSKAERMAKLPKSRLKRIIYYLHPVRAFKFWFSKRGLILGLKITGVTIAVIIFAVIALFSYYRREIDADPKKLQASLLEQTTRFYDNSGARVIYSLHGDEDRTWVELSEIADVMENATIAVEDKDFYSHGGFSFTGIARAAWNNVFGNSEYTSGGSTITQQFVKNALLSNEKTYTRKIKELILALEIERLYTKDEILEFYLNEIPYGGTEYGVESAAQSFFGKPASKLNTGEAALLAALPQAPGALSPYGESTDDLVARQHVVLDLMVQQGYITQELADNHKAHNILEDIVALEDKNQFKDLVAPHYVVEVQKQLEEIFGESLVLSGGLKVVTTLDYEAQLEANKAVRQNMTHVERPRNGRGSGGDNAALVAIDIETGHIVAMVGSRDYNYPGFGAFNSATSPRQPGSSFKVYVYSQLLYNERWGPDSVIYDTTATFNNYKPQNFDFTYRGRITVRQALGESRNIPAVKAMHIGGVDNVLDLARAMGNKSLGENGAFLGLSAALGAGEVKLVEHTAGYATLARSGQYIEPAYILRVENSAGEVLYELESPEPQQVLDPQNAYLMTNILTDDAARSATFGFNSPRLTVPGLTHAVKTGTTNGSTDGWMMGYSHYYAVGTWVGNHDNAPMNTTTSWQNGPIFTQFLREIHKKKKLPNVPIYDKAPSGIKTVKVDSNTGWAATDASTKTRNGLFPSWHVKQVPPKDNVAYTIDTVSGNLATECTPEMARKEVKGSRLWPEILPDDPFFGNWSKAAGYSATDNTPKATDDVHSCNDKLPKVNNIGYTDLGGGEYEIEISISEGTHPMDTIEIYVDGNKVKTINYDNNNLIVDVRNLGQGIGNVSYRVHLVDEVLYEDDATETIPTGDLVLSVTEGSPVTETEFSWNEVIPAKSYKLCIDPSTAVQKCYVATNTFYEIILPIDNYTAFVQAWSESNTSGNLQNSSAEISFSIP